MIDWNDGFVFCWVDLNNWDAMILKIFLLITYFFTEKNFFYGKVTGEGDFKLD